MEIKPEFEKIFKEADFKITLFPEKENIKKFKSLLDFGEFIQKEVDFWEDYNGDNYLKSIYSIFLQINNNLVNMMNSTNEQQFISYFSTLKQQVSDISHEMVYSDTAIGKFIVEQCEINPKRAAAAYYFFTRNSSPFNLQDLDHLKGTLSAFLFTDMDDALSKKKSAEKLSFSQIRAKYQRTIDETDINFDDFMKNINNKKDSFENEITEWKNEEVKSLKDNIDKKNKIFEQRSEQWEKKILDLENLYEEKLRLEGPARFWEELDEAYEKKGKKWKWWTIITSSILMTILLLIFYNFPEWLIPFNSKWSFVTLKGSLILATIISVGIFLIRFFIKLSTSAYHLSRDARERFQLTHSYLALIKENILKPEDRTIILQSLFSRADTGLLKGDSTPTLPNSVISRLINK
jgi:uncharacterized membrane protein (DUF485 family)